MDSNSQFSCKEYTQIHSSTRKICIEKARLCHGMKDQERTNGPVKVHYCSLGMEVTRLNLKHDAGARALKKRKIVLPAVTWLSES
uniref:Uncharacterized protein n=1 Tax=Rhipicephalus zambeziensis TaxID=60191 RepID=A0A224Y5X5_9ACAR